MMHTLKSASGSLSAMIAIALLLTSAVTTYAELLPPLEVSVASDNFSQPIIGSTEPRSLFSLHERQSNCNAPNKYCTRYGFCCSASAGGCCRSGCASADISECCTNGNYCTTGEKCCNGGCIPESGQCCNSGGYCPQPFICVVQRSTGNRGCCTDLSCSVYYSDGATVTATTSRAPSTTRRATTAPTTRPDPTPVITTPDPITTPFTTSSRTSQGVVYTTYTTTIYWSYWYYFYTLYYAPSTYTTIFRTTTTSTTTLSATARDSLDARLSFSLASNSLPTPSDAQSFPPITPTAGALVIGSCASTSTSTLTDGNGSRTSRVVSVCETVTADGSGGSRGGTGGSSTNAAATTTTMSAPVQRIMLLVMVSVLFASLAMAVIL